MSTETNKKALTETEVISALEYLADFSWKSFDGNRNYEWKTNFALWAALAGFAGLMLRENIHVSAVVAIIVSAMISVVFLVYWLAWTTSMWRRNYDDTESAWADLHEIRKLINVPAHAAHRPEIENAPSWGYRDYINVWGNWSRGSQLALTLIFCLIAIAVILAAVPSVSPQY
jgi:hypothetical protein